MVKGVAKRIVVVKSPDRRVFEEAIFIVREDGAGGGVSAAEALREARRVITSCSEGCIGLRGRLRRIPAPAYAAFGASAVGLLWLATVLL